MATTTTTTTTTQELEIHPFERAGLGKAPFQYIQISEVLKYGEKVIGVIDGIEIVSKPGGTCDYCGAAIVNIFNVRSSDGKVFKVGCECIKKCDKALGKVVDAEARKLIKARKLAKDKARIAAAIERGLTLEAQLRALPHPKGWEGKTLWHWFLWTLDNAGISGKLELARRIEKLS